MPTKPSGGQSGPTHSISVGCSVQTLERYFVQSVHLKAQSEDRSDSYMVQLPTNAQAVALLGVLDTQLTARCSTHKAPAALHCSTQNAQNQDPSQPERCHGERPAWWDTCTESVSSTHWVAWQQQPCSYLVLARVLWLERSICRPIQW